MSIRHILLTRFALLHPQSSEEWLEHRIELFEKYTLPSVEKQTCKNFEWYLIANPNFPGIKKFRIDKYARVLWEDWKWDEDQDNIGKLFRSGWPWIRGREIGRPWLISSRLDSDDILAEDFIERIQNTAEEKEEWLSIPRGYMVKGDKAYPRYYEKSPFVSFVEKRHTPKTVLHTPHTKADSVRIIDDKPGWIQLDHGKNIKNSVERAKLVRYINVNQIEGKFSAYP